MYSWEISEGDKKEIDWRDVGREGEVEEGGKEGDKEGEEGEGVLGADVVNVFCCFCCLSCCCSLKKVFSISPSATIR